jgi:DNA-directed RNA polymerase subunit RPC12/RpoP
MPWCEGCERYLSNPTLRRDGSCPACGRRVAGPAKPKAPWHFKLLVGAAGGYLLMRAFQGLAWVARNVSG